VKCDPQAQFEIRGPYHELPLYEWHGMLSNLARSHGGKLYKSSSRARRVKIRVPFGAGEAMNRDAEPFRSAKREVIVKETEQQP